MSSEMKQHLKDLFFHVLFWVGTGLMFYTWSNWFVSMNTVYNFDLYDLFAHVLFLLGLTILWRLLIDRIAKKRKN